MYVLKHTLLWMVKLLLVLPLYLLIGIPLWVAVGLYTLIHPYLYVAVKWSGGLFLVVTLWMVLDERLTMQEMFPMIGMGIVLFFAMDLVPIPILKLMEGMVLLQQKVHRLLGVDAKEER